MSLFILLKILYFVLITTNAQKRPLIKKDVNQSLSPFKMELNPSTFAKRYGSNFGSTLPNWLQELNNQHYSGIGNRRQGITHNGNNQMFNHYADNHKNYYESNQSNGWVKLDAIPVTAVKISKWVSKNTTPSQLPSTATIASNWPHLNSNFQSINHKKPGELNSYGNWFNGNQNSRKPYISHRTPYHPSPPNTNIFSSNSNWPSRYGSNDNQHGNIGSWSDVIYPVNNPISATASWASDPLAISNQKWKKSSTRYPIGGWKAPSSFQSNWHNSNQGTSSTKFNYPDESNVNSQSYYLNKDPSRNDPNWILISSSKNRQYEDNSPTSKYNSSIQKRREKMLNLNNYTNKLEKIGLMSNGSNSINHSILPLHSFITQDELFHRTNETLNSLTPVLTQKYNSFTTIKSLENGKGTSFPITEKLIDILTSTASNIIEKTTKKYIDSEEGRSSKIPSISMKTNTKFNNPFSIKNNNKGYKFNDFSSLNLEKKKIRKESGLNTAGIGLSILPSSFGSVLPLVLTGKKKRHV